MDDPQVIVVGGGIAGCAAALRAAQYYLRTLWLMGDKHTAKNSRARYVYNIDNMIGVHPGIVKRALHRKLVEESHEDAARMVRDTHLVISTQDVVDNVVERLTREYPDHALLVHDAATGAHEDGDVFTVTTRDGSAHSAPYLVLATGVMDRQPSIKLTTAAGKVRDDIKWIYPYANAETVLYCIRCEGHLTRYSSTAVIGSDGVQTALQIRERYGTEVHLLTNGEPLDATEDERKLLEHYGIDVHTERITGFIDGQRAKGMDLQGIVLESGVTLEVSFGFVSMGLYRVYNELARQLGADLDPRDADRPEDRRHVLVDEAASETTVRNLYAVGDMSRRPGKVPSLKQIYTAQEYAVRAVDSIDRRIRRARRKQILEAK